MVMDGKGWHSATPKGLITTRWRVMVCIYIYILYVYIYIYINIMFSGGPGSQVIFFVQPT